MTHSVLRELAIASLLLLVSCSGGPSQAPASSATAAPPSASPALVGDLEADVQLDKRVYAPNEKMKVQAIAMGLSETAWVWVVPGDKRPQEALKPERRGTDYIALAKGFQAELSAPSKPGTYALCLYAASSFGPEVTRRAFQVEGPAKTPFPKVRIESDANPFQKDGKP